MRFCLLARVNDLHFENEELEEVKKADLASKGDFSFALSLLSAPHCHPGHQVCATSYDSESTCLSKYPTTAPDNIASLRQRGCRVEFGIDAGSPEALLKLTARLTARWSKVVFNFPHVGQGHKDEGRNVLANQALLIRFLVAAAPCLSRGDAPRYVTGGSGVGKGKEREGSVSSVEEEANDDELDEMSLGDEEEEEEDQGQMPPKKEAKVGLVTPSRAGSVLITLRNCPPYTKWDVGMLAKQLVLVCEPTIRSAPALPKGQHPPSQAQLQAVRELASSEKGFKVWRSFAFDKTLWKGYEHRRTLGWKPSWQDVTQKGLSGREEDDLGQQECRTWELGLQ